MATTPQPPAPGTWEYFLLTRETWAAASGPLPADMSRAIRTREPHWLCVGCLEQRLGRQLTPADFQSEGWRGFWRLARPLWTSRQVAAVYGCLPPPPSPAWLAMLAAAAREVTPEEFTAALAAALAGWHLAPFVTQLPPEAIRAAGMRPFLAAGGKAGRLIHDHGDGRIELRSGFNRSGVAGLGHALRAWAVREHGANCGAVFCGSPSHKGVLALGFTEVSRVPFDPALAPPGWDAARFGTPDYLTLELPAELRRE